MRSAHVFWQLTPGSQMQYTLEAWSARLPMITSPMPKSPGVSKFHVTDSVPVMKVHRRRVHLVQQQRQRQICVMQKALLHALPTLERDTHIRICVMQKALPHALPTLERDTRIQHAPVIGTKVRVQPTHGQVVTGPGSLCGSHSLSFGASGIDHQQKPSKSQSMPPVSM